MFTDSGEQVRFRTRKHFALLIRLALDPGKPFTRDYLADLLWPGAAPKLANHSLAQGLSVIKAKIAREAVLLQRSTVGLAGGWVDVDVHHLTNGAIGVDGPFLDSFEIPAARPFEEWKDECRARLMPQMRDCLVRQMDAARRIGDFPTVERHALRLRELDPLAEEAIRGIMEARAWASDRSGALKAFARYEEQIEDELGAKPSADLLRMADLLRDGRRSTTRPATPGSAPERVERRFEPETLIGREREFSVLYDAWLEARRKNPRIVVITSDPGVGKTTLVNAFASTCQMDGAIVARAQAYDAERELPFAVLGELVKQLAMQRAIGSADPEALSELTRISGEIVKQFPGVPKPVEWSPELTPLRIADAFLKTVSSAAQESPLLIVVDDLHAADNASTAILHSLARKLTTSRVLIILTGRSSELRLSSAPWSLMSDSSLDRLARLELDVLTPIESEELILRLVGGARSNPPLERLHRVSGGNPLAAELITREWLEHGDGTLLKDIEALDTQPVPSMGIPRAIGAVFERQTTRLQPSVRAVLDLAAILGRRLMDVFLYEAIELTPGQAAESLSRLKDEGYLREIRGDLEFRNELIRAQAYYAIAGATRQHLHRRVAELLAEHSDGKSHLEIAWHFLRGADNAHAIPFALQGSEAVLAVGAPHGAEEILKAIAERDTSPIQEKQVLLLLIKALLDQSKAAAALPVLERLGRRKDLTQYERAKMAMFSASAEFISNTQPGARYCELAKEAVSAAVKTDDSVLLSEALFECARAGTEEGLFELIVAAEQGIDRLADAPEFMRMPMAVLTKAFCRYCAGDMQAALAFLERAEALEADNANAAQLAFLYSGIGLTNYFLGRLGVSYEAYRKAIGLLRRVGDDARTSVMASNLSHLQTQRGNYEDAIALGALSVSMGESCSSSALLTSYTNLIDPYLLTGQEDAAVACFEKARRWMTPERRWKMKLTFLQEAASFALLHRNESLAIDLIGQLVTAASGRENAVAMPAPYWKLKGYRLGQLGQWEDAREIVTKLEEKWRHNVPSYYLDIIGLRAWLERRQEGRLSSQTARELAIFDELGALGRKALLTMQGFLPSATELIGLSPAG